MDQLPYLGVVMLYYIVDRSELRNVIDEIYLCLVYYREGGEGKGKEEWSHVESVPFWLNVI